MDKESQQNLLDHSEAKVRLLGEYLLRYLSVVANAEFTRAIRIYDLFCGEGVYRNGGEGSPIVITRAVKDVYFKRRAKGLRVAPIDCLFNDAAPEKVQKAAQAIQEKHLHYPEIGKLRFEHKDYKEVLAE